MIPKIIHYCWFGRGEKPELIKNCINSWKRFCPDYQIIEWNEDNFDVSMYEYTKEAYEAKKWAFVSDVARLYALYNFGGIYLDTDMELLKPIDKIIENCEGVLAFEAKDFVCLGIIAANAKNSFIFDLKKEYEQIRFYNQDGSYQMTTNVRRMRKHLIKKGLANNGKKQVIDGFTIFPQNYFFPNTFFMLFGKLPKSAYAIHHATASWKGNNVVLSNKGRIKSYSVNKARNIFGTDFIENLRDRKKGNNK